MVTTPLAHPFLVDEFGVLSGSDWWEAWLASSSDDVGVVSSLDDLLAAATTRTSFHRAAMDDADASSRATASDTGSTIQGTSGADVVTSSRSVAGQPKTTDREDHVFGLGGNDRIETGGGNDRVEAGSGKDVVRAGSGDDVVFGGDGNDDLRGEAGDDRIEGGNGNDTIDGGAGNDVLLGDSQPDDSGNVPLERGNDVIRGGSGDDVVIGNEGNDELWGDADDDILDGRAGNDEVHGGSGNDVVLGLNGNDDLYGDAGNDNLRDGAGSDDFWGGSGSDVFEYARDDDIGRDGGTPFPGYGIGNDRIMDFDFSERDRIAFYLNDETVVSVKDNGRDTTIGISDGETLRIVGLTGRDFSSDLRFASLEDVNVVSNEYYDYDAILI